MRRHLGGRIDSLRERAVERDHGLPCGEVHQMDAPALELGQREVALDHEALGCRRVPAESELRRDRALVHVPAARRAPAPRSGGRAGGRSPRCSGAPAAAGRAGHRPAVVRERAAPGRRELGHLGELLAALALADRGHEAGRDDRLLARARDEVAEDGGRVDDRVGVRHREDRAVAARGGGLGPRAERLLVLASGSAEVDVRVDEGGRDDELARRRRLDPPR